MIAVETKELNDMTREGFEDGNFNPAHSLGNIYNLIFGLSAKIKEEGQYLLKRDGAKNGAFVQGIFLFFNSLEKTRCAGFV